MVNERAGAVASVAMALLLIACNDGGDSEPECVPGTTFAGDSNVFLPGWADVLVEDLRERGEYAERAAFGGLQTVDFLPDVETHRPIEVPTCDVVVLLGTNDAGHERPWREFIDNYRAMVDGWIRTWGVRRVVILIPPPVYNEVLYDEEVNERLARYRSALLDYCEESFDDEVECGADLWLAEREHLGDDGTHFSLEGHAWVYAQVLPLVCEEGLE